MKKALKYILGIFAILILLAAYAAYSLLSSPFGIAEKAYVYIDDDDDMDSVYKKVRETGEVSNMLGFTITSKIKATEKPKTGKYAITAGEDMFTFARHMLNGMQEPVHLIVPEVRTVNDMAERLGKSLMLSSEDLMSVLNDSTFMDSLGYSKENVPCLFVPNTYDVYWDISPKNLVLRLHKEKERFWTQERQDKAKACGFTKEQVVTLASIVESETSYNPEKSRIAGLYINRLRTDMPLQSDPTVIFALQDFTIRRVSKEHLKVESPYNTYTNIGLPPGPIRIPSVRGIDAVLNYEHNDYLYMCAKEDFSGSHNFTSSYNEHLSNARKYQSALNTLGIKK